MSQLAIPQLAFVEVDAGSSGVCTMMPSLIKSRKAVLINLMHFSSSDNLFGDGHFLFAVVVELLLPLKKEGI